MKRINGRPQWVRWGEYLIERIPMIGETISYERAERIAKKKRLLILSARNMEVLIAWQNNRLIDLDGPMNFYWNANGSVTYLDESNHISSWSRPIDYLAYVRFAKLFVEDR